MTEAVMPVRLGGRLIGFVMIGQVRIEMALDKADEYFRNDAGMRVSEVASRLGFDDPLYFSRLYRKHRGVPPSRRVRRT